MDVDRLIGLLPASLHQEDPEARRVLAAMLEPIGQVDDYLDARTRKLGELLDPAEVPDDLVAHLAALVGVGKDLAAANLATTAELRKLIPVAVRLWKIKGTRPSWAALAAALTGSRSLVLDWFYLRTISGSGSRVAVIPGPGTGGVYPYANADRVTDLWIMDPAGTANLELLARFLDVARPAGERINLRAADLVDDLGAGAALWAALPAAPGSWSWDSTTRELHARDGYGFAADLDGLEAGWESYHALLRLAVTGTARVLVRTDGADHYQVTIDQAAGTVALARVVGGVTTPLVTFAGPPLVAAFPYLWSFEAWEGSSSTTVRVYRDGAKLVDYVDSAARPGTGGLTWRSVGPGDLATLSTALIWPAGVTMTRIGPTP